MAKKFLDDKGLKAFIDLFNNSFFTKKNNVVNHDKFLIQSINAEKIISKKSNQRLFETNSKNTTFKVGQVLTTQNNYTAAFKVDHSGGAVIRNADNSTSKIILKAPKTNNLYKSIEISRDTIKLRSSANNNITLTDNRVNLVGDVYFKDVSLHCTFSGTYTDTQKNSLSTYSLQETLLKSYLHSTSAHAPVDADSKVKVTTGDNVSSPQVEDKFNNLTFVNYNFTSGNITPTLYMTDGLQVYVNTGTTSAAGGLYLKIGNEKSATTAGNKKGYLRIYDSTIYYGDLKTATLSANQSWNLPNKSGTIALTSDLSDLDEKVKTDETNHDTGGNYPIPFVLNTSSASHLGRNDGLNYFTLQGTTSAIGTARIAIGNATASGTANNKRGSVRLYAGNANYVEIFSGDSNGTLSASANVYITKAGTIAMISDLPTVNDGQLTIKQNNSQKGTFKANTSSSPTVELTDKYIQSDDFDNATGGSYNIPFLKTAGSIDITYYNSGFKYYTFTGTTSAMGYSRLELGNNISTGTADNKRGYLRLYSDKNGYTDILTTDGLTVATQYKLPFISGVTSYTIAPIHADMVVLSQFPGSKNFNQIATYGNAIGYATNVTSTDSKINPPGTAASDAYTFINMSYKIQGQSVFYLTQIANKAGTTDLWVRSRNGGAISDSTAWAAPWTRILTGSNWQQVITLPTKDSDLTNDKYIKELAVIANNSTSATANSTSAVSDPYLITRYTIGSTSTNKYAQIKGSAPISISANGGVITVSHSTAAGYSHIPSSGSSGQFLGWNSAGTAKWVDNPNVWIAFVGATSSAAGTAGYIPAPGKNVLNSVFRSNGTWADMSVMLNTLSEGASPATRNDYIIAQYAGGGTSTTTYHRRSLANIFKALNSSDITTALGYTPIPNAGNTTEDNLSIERNAITLSSLTNILLSAEGSVSLESSSNSIEFATSDGNIIANPDRDHKFYYGSSSVANNEVATIGHTHPLSIATTTDTNQITLSHGSKYKLTAGGSTYVFTMPSDTNNYQTDILAVSSSDTNVYNLLAGNAANTSAETNQKPRKLNSLTYKQSTGELTTPKLILSNTDGITFNTNGIWKLSTTTNCLKLGYTANNTEFILANSSTKRVSITGQLAANYTGTIDTSSTDSTQVPIETKFQVWDTEIYLGNKKNNETAKTNYLRMSHSHTYLVSGNIVSLTAGSTIYIGKLEEGDTSIRPTRIHLETSTNSIDMLGQTTTISSPQVRILTSNGNFELKDSTTYLENSNVRLRSSSNSFDLDSSTIYIYSSTQLNMQSSGTTTIDAGKIILDANPIWFGSNGNNLISADKFQLRSKTIDLYNGDYGIYISDGDSRLDSQVSQLRLTSDAAITTNKFRLYNTTIGHDTSVAQRLKFYIDTNIPALTFSQNVLNRRYSDNPYNTSFASGEVSSVFGDNTVATGNYSFITGSGSSGSLNTYTPTAKSYNSTEKSWTLTFTAAQITAIQNLYKATTFMVLIYANGATISDSTIKPCKAIIASTTTIKLIKVPNSGELYNIINNTAIANLRVSVYSYNHGVIGANSFVTGFNNISLNDNQAVIGKYNATGNYAFIIGGGSATNARDNLLTIDWNGNTILKNISGGDLSLTLERKSKSSWQIVNSSGTLYIKNNYTTAVTTYFNVLQLDYNTGNITANKGKFIGNLQGNADTATTATKLSNTSKIGDTNKPVYFSASGVPVAINYTIDKSVPSNAVFTDTHYTSKNVVCNSATGTTNTTAALTNGNVYLNHIEQSTLTSSHKIVGSGGTSVTTDTSGNITITSPSLGTGSTNAAYGNHTHTTTIATSTGTNQLTLAFGTKYAITAGGTSYVFTMPSNPNTDTKVRQTNNTTNAEYRLLLSYAATNNQQDNISYKSANFTANPSTGDLTVGNAIKAKEVQVNTKWDIQTNATTGALEFNLM